MGDDGRPVIFTPDGLGNSLLHIYEISNHKGNYFYQIKGKYQFTYEYACSPDEGDYMNIVTMSDERYFFSQEPCAEHNRLFGSALQHYHDYYEFMIILEGNVIQQIEGREYKYTAGSGCLINRGIRHCEGFEGSGKILFMGLSLEMAEELLHLGTPLADAGTGFWASVPGKFIAADIKNPGRSTYLDFLPAYSNDTHYRRLMEMTESLVKELMFPSFGSYYRIRSMICDFLSYLAEPENYHCTEVELGAGNDYLLFTRIGHLMEERNGRVSRAELESLLNYSGDYLNRIVKKYSGMPLFDYGMTFCLKKAEYLLESSTESVAEIAARCGFTNKTHFYKWFRKLFGTTPMAYRRRSADTDTGAER